MKIVDLSRSDDIIFLQWEITMMFKRFPSSTVHGCTKLTMDEEGLFIRQRDYHDL